MKYLATFPFSLFSTYFCYTLSHCSEIRFIIFIYFHFILFFSSLFSFRFRFLTMYFFFIIFFLIRMLILFLVFSNIYLFISYLLIVGLLPITFDFQSLSMLKKKKEYFALFRFFCFTFFLH